MQEWWGSFFSGAWLAIQRQVTSEEETAREADFVKTVLQLQPKTAGLDIPCGEGRLSLALAARGVYMTGVDITREFLEDAQYKAADRHLEITWEQRDMRDLPWKEQFDGAVCFGGSFGYFDDDGNKMFLKAVFRTLKPGSRFLIDTHSVESLLPTFRQRDWHRVKGILVVANRSFDYVNSRINAEYTIIQGSTITKKSSSIRIYTYRELCQVLEETGFCNCEAYGSVDLEPFTLGSPRLYMVASKP